MKSKLTCIAFFTFVMTQFCSGQTAKYFIEFTDRNNNPFSINNPSAYLSQRAIDRRLTQGIPIQQNDLPVNPNYVDSVISKGAIVHTQSKWFNGVTISADATTLQSILSLPFVVQSVHVSKPVSDLQQDEKREAKFYVPLRSQEEDLARVFSADYGTSFNQIHIMNGDYLHDSGFHGEGKVIALLDAGYFQVDQLPAFDSIRINNQILSTWDFVAGEPSVYEDDSHGMSVLSTIGGNIPGQLVGTAPKASFLLLRTEDIFSETLVEEYNWNAGAEFADSAGADVISSSLGYTTFDDPSQNHSYADMNGHTTPSTIAANIAFSKGMLVVLSAGNSGNGPWHYIGAPSDADSALAIGAVNGSGMYAWFSSTGPSSDGDIKPNLAAVGQGTVISKENGTIGFGSGTSFSCPLLAGSATCFWQAFPSLTNKQIFNAIQLSASQHLNPDSLLGYGIPDFMLAGIVLGGIDKTQSGIDNKLTVNPNPFIRDVSFSFYSESNQYATIHVYDAVGKKVHVSGMEAKGKTHNYAVLSLDNLQRGIYILEIITANGRAIQKIIKT